MLLARGGECGTPARRTRPVTGETPRAISAHGALGIRSRPLVYPATPIGPSGSTIPASGQRGAPTR